MKAGDCVCGPLHFDGLHADDLGCVLILANGDQRPADVRALDRIDERGYNDRESKEDEIEQPLDIRAASDPMGSM
jgi:hypothetical protein